MLTVMEDQDSWMSWHTCYQHSTELVSHWRPSTQHTHLNYEHLCKVSPKEQQRSMKLTHEGFCYSLGLFPCIEHWRIEFLGSIVAIWAFGDQTPSNDQCYTPLVEVNRAIRQNLRSGFIWPMLLVIHGLLDV